MMSDELNGTTRGRRRVVAAAFAILVAAPHLSVHAEIALTGARLEARIDDATGALVSLTDLRDGLALLRNSADRYALQPDPDTEVIATEAEDKVITRDGDLLICENPKLPGIRIEKQYALEDRFLTKRVKFTARQQDIGLLKYSVGSTASPEFYGDGYLNDPSRHPLDYPYIFTKDLKAERRILDCNAAADHHLAIFTSPAHGRGLAQYRFKVDGRFVHPLTSYSYEPGLFYGPEGWRLAVAAKWMSDDREPLECETRWHLFDGDHVAFHQQYMALPEFAAEWDWASPAWVRDVQGVTSWGWTASSPILTRYKDIADSLGGGYLMVMLSGIFHNTRAYWCSTDVECAPGAVHDTGAIASAGAAERQAGPGEYSIPAAEGVPLPAKELRRIVDELHALSPRIKVGPITWQWAFGELDPILKQHPEWTVHDPLGGPAFAASGWRHERVYSQLLTPECRRFVLSQFEGMCKRYDFDFIYMDTGQGGVTRFDWNTKWGAQDYDWADLYKGIRDAARANRNGATFFNGTPRLYSSYCDCGYFEGVGFINVRDWRALADRLFLVKLYQPGDKWTMPLYWRKNVLELYPAYCLALGLRAGSFVGSPVTGKRWPIIAAINELAQTRLVPEANARPCWWKEPTEIEAYALKLPGGAILSAINHDEGPVQAKLSCDVAPLGLDPGAPICVWLFRPKLVAELDATVKSTEADANELYANTGNAAYRCCPAEFLGAKSFADGRAQVQFSLDPGRIALVLLTQSPTLATAVDGCPRQLLLPPPKGARAATVPADRPLTPEIIGCREAFQPPKDLVSALLFPPRSSPEVMNRKVTEVGREVAGLKVARLLAYDCEHNLGDLATAETLGDPPGLRLTADIGLDKKYGYAHGGVEATNAGTLTLRLSLDGPLYGRFFPGGFAGLVADYHTGEQYTQRVRFALSPMSRAIIEHSRPWWGFFDSDPQARSPLWVDLSDKLKSDETRELTLDLGRYAPEGWTGRVVFGPYLESCGYGTKLTVDMLGNGPAGQRDPQAFAAPPPPPARGKVAAVFHNANIYRFEDGAELRDERIFFPLRGAIEADGLRITRWLIKREENSKAAQIWINFQQKDLTYHLIKRDVSGEVAPGAEAELDLDLGQLAPEDWNGRVRIRLAGDGVSAELISNSPFQIF